jgi:hypothetical protein
VPIQALFSAAIADGGATIWTQTIPLRVHENVTPPATPPLADSPLEPLALLPDPLPELAPPLPPEHPATSAAPVNDTKSRLMKRSAMFSTPSVALIKTQS